MGDILGSSNKKKSLAATNAMLRMKKIVIADLQRAYDQA
jgi:predicted 3-demethylubiquinone-9 3-methyltransferase (glyoxalase superfamily)